MGQLHLVKCNFNRTLKCHEAVCKKIENASILYVVNENETEIIFLTGGLEYVHQIVKWKGTSKQINKVWDLVKKYPKSTQVTQLTKPGDFDKLNTFFTCTGVKYQDDAKNIFRDCRDRDRVAQDWIDQCQINMQHGTIPMKHFFKEYLHKRELPLGWTAHKSSGQTYYVDPSGK